MRVLVTGATGFIGRALVPVLQREGHTVVAWARSEARARARLGADIETVHAASGIDGLTSALERCDAVINLAGEPLLGGRWTAARRAKLGRSRVHFTAQIVRAIAAARQRPRVLVSGSAVGYYGDRADEVLDEDAARGIGFLPDLCRGWEAAARAAEDLGVRVVMVRTGVALGRDGGALAQMLPPFKLGLGGPIGHGRQYLPWIHLHDLVAVIAAALVDDRMRGPINGVGPDPVSSRDFAKALGRALGRPAVLPTPVLALRLLFGQASEVMLASQRVVPAALRHLGFPFAFPTLDGALADVLGGVPVAVGPLSGPIDAGASEAGREYLDTRRPTRELRMTTTVRAPLNETFAFFSKAGNLGLLTPASMKFSLEGSPPVIRENTTIDYRLRIGPVPIIWRSRIVNWMPGSRFADFQERGPYRSWWHEHSFRAAGRSTVMEDRVCYAPPLGVMGRLAGALFIEPTLRRIFRYRADVIRLRFGAPEAGSRE
jgi:uncharacterized protein (TIGR01777 family)